MHCGVIIARRTTDGVNSVQQSAVASIGILFVDRILLQVYVRPATS